MSSFARIVSESSYVVPNQLKITEHVFSVPLDYSLAGVEGSQPSERIRIIARSAEKVKKPTQPDDINSDKKLPLLCFFQGGPGFGCRPPQESGWTRPFLEKGFKVFCMDQRGTGFSSILTAKTIKARGKPEAQLDYIKLFRADSIVRDAEEIRKVLVAEHPPELRKWSILGQSFGGFCCVSYLSIFPASLKEAFVTGGLPPLMFGSLDQVYQRLCKRMEERSSTFYVRYPDDVNRVKKLCRYLQQNEVRSSDGGRLTADRLRAAGIILGAHGTFYSLHSLLVRLEQDLDELGYLSKPSMHAFESYAAFETAVIYALLHEPCYDLCQRAANWAAERTIKELPQFEINTDESSPPILFTAEAITQNMFHDFDELHQLKDVADLTAEHSNWPPLYDLEQLERNEIPVFAAIYYDDLYVDRSYSEATAKTIKNTKVFITNTLYHDALGSKSEEVVRELFRLRDAELD